MRGPLNYIGGKNRLAKVIIERIPDHLTYVEPFSGGAQVFFHKSRSKIEVLNDLDSQLVNFYRVCQSHHEELIRSLRFMPVSREWFQNLERTPPENLTDIQRAARFLYLQKLAYGGRVTRKAFGIHVTAKPNLREALISETLANTHARLPKTPVDVVLEQIGKQEKVSRLCRRNSIRRKSCL